MNEIDVQMVRQWLEHWKLRGIQYLPKVAEELVSASNHLVENRSANSRGVANSSSTTSTKPAQTATVGSSSTPLGNRSPLSSPTPMASPTPTTSPTDATMASPVLADPPLAAPPVVPTQWSLPCLDTAERVANFEVLSKKVAACQLCQQLAVTRKQTVFGEGNLNAKIVFFGEAPGFDEDRTGRPFVGKAGELLDKIIVASQLKREDVYIMNTLKCRPPGNRTPSESEVAQCRPFFEQQLEVLQPDYIVCLGVVAVRALLGGTESIGQLRGRWHAYRSAKLLVTYHPAYLLRQESAKKLTWEDMQMLMRDLGLKLPTQR